MNNWYQDYIKLLYSIRSKVFEGDYMIDEQTTNEEFIRRFYRNIVLNSKHRFEVDYMIDEHSANEEFAWKILLKYCAQFEAQICELDYMIDGHTRQMKNSY